MAAKTDSLRFVVIKVTYRGLQMEGQSPLGSSCRALNAVRPQTTCETASD
jgi:hypothetical protein